MLYTPLSAFFHLQKVNYFPYLALCLGIVRLHRKIADLIKAKRPGRGDLVVLAAD